MGRWRLGVVLGFTFVSTGCVGFRESASDSVATVTVDAEAYRTVARRVLPRATLSKPRSSPDANELYGLAPLIVNEISSDANSTAEEAEAMPNRVYAGKSATMWHDREFGQLTYLWFYPREAGEPASKWRGVRLTLGSDGFVVLAEPLGWPAEARLFYVSTSFEAAARSAFGEPLAGRRFSTEREVADAPRAVVVGTLEDGPVPMGPYVYLTSGSRQVMTVLCRCSPAQVEEFAVADYYDIEPIEVLAALAESNDSRLAEVLSPWFSRSRSLPTTDSLEPVLRLPPE